MSLLIFFGESGPPPPVTDFFIEVPVFHILERKPRFWPVAVSRVDPDWRWAWRRRPHLVLPFWEGASDRFRDVSGYSRHAFGSGATSTPAWTTGRYGRTLLFDEIDDRMAVDLFEYEADQATVTPEFTILIVLQLPSNTGSQFKYIWSQGTVGGSDSLNIYVREGSNASDPGEITTNIRLTGAGSSNSPASNVVVDDGLWHTYAMTLDTTRKLDIYIDGSRTTGANPANGTGGFNPAEEVRIGSNFLSGGGTSSDRFFGGNLALVSCMRGAWSADQVLRWSKKPFAFLYPAGRSVANVLSASAQALLIKPEELGFGAFTSMN
jgi:hypothetical protein